VPSDVFLFSSKHMHMIDHLYPMHSFPFLSFFIIFQQSSAEGVVEFVRRQPKAKGGGGGGLLLLPLTVAIMFDVCNTNATRGAEAAIDLA
jgi:hypothetical protein